MKSHARRAFVTLKSLGVPVIDHGDPDNQWQAYFIISGERLENDSRLWADYYQCEVMEHYGDNMEIRDASGIREEIHSVLSRYNLYAEWIDAGTVGVYDV